MSSGGAPPGNSPPPDLVCLLGDWPWDTPTTYEYFRTELPVLQEEFGLRHRVLRYWRVTPFGLFFYFGKTAPATGRKIAESIATNCGAELSVNFAETASQPAAAPPVPVRAQLTTPSFFTEEMVRHGLCVDSKWEDATIICGAEPGHFTVEATIPISMTAILFASSISLFEVPCKLVISRAADILPPRDDASVQTEVEVEEDAMSQQSAAETASSNSSESGPKQPPAKRRRPSSNKPPRQRRVTAESLQPASQPAAATAPQPPSKPSRRCTHVRCFRCQRWGHAIADCKATEDVCNRCSGHHRTAECTSTTRRCANCGDSHSASSTSCRARPAPPPRRTQPRSTTNTTNKRRPDNRQLLHLLIRLLS